MIVVVDDEHLLPEPPADALDFPVAVPADLSLADVAVSGRGWGRSGGPDAPVRWGSVDVAPRTRRSTDGDEEVEPPWRLSTRPKRGVRPAGPARTGVLVDPSPAGLAWEAVTTLLAGRVPAGLGAEDHRRRSEQDQETARRLQASFALLPAADSGWDRRELEVGGDRYAWWVHEDALGWAGVADLGVVALLGHGTGAVPAGWTLRLLPRSEAAELLRDGWG